MRLRCEAGQLTTAVVEGWGHPITVVSVYRRNPKDVAFESLVLATLNGLGDKPWVVGADWNERVRKE